MFLDSLFLGLLILLDEHASLAAQIAYPLVAGIGIGMLFHAPYQVFTRALKPQELATGTSAFFLVRFTGATIGLVSTSLETTKTSQLTRDSMRRP
jgi:predicted PurR-regulated permease PerM